MKTFYFNTGVVPSTVHNPEFPYEYHKKKGHVIKGGTLQIPFDCDAPEGSVLVFMSDEPGLPDSANPSIIVCKVFNTTMSSKYAYFRKA